MFKDVSYVQSLQRKLNLEMCLILTFQINYLSCIYIWKWIRLHFYLIIHFCCLFILFVIIFVVKIKIKKYDNKSLNFFISFLNIQNNLYKDFLLRFTD